MALFAVTPGPEVTLADGSLALQAFGLASGTSMRSLTNCKNSSHYSWPTSLILVDRGFLPPTFPFLCSRAQFWWCLLKWASEGLLLGLSGHLISDIDTVRQRASTSPSLTEPGEKLAQDCSWDKGFLAPNLKCVRLRWTDVLFPESGNWHPVVTCLWLSSNLSWLNGFIIFFLAQWFSVSMQGIFLPALLHAHGCTHTHTHPSLIWEF